MTYLDYAATAPLLPEVAAAMQEALQASTCAPAYANSSALHTPGHRASLVIEETRELLAGLIHADPSEIIFTASATESNNTIIRTFEGHEIETSPIEHHSILESAKLYRGYKSPKLYSYMFANNETGEILDVAKIAKKAHTEGNSIHSDLTQAFGKIPIDVKALDLDYATLSAHKIGGPIGIAALYIRNGAPFKPLLIGGDQEHRRRAGTHNAIAAVGFREALQSITQKNTYQEYDTKIRTLRDTLAREITTTIPDTFPNTDTQKGCSLPNILNISFHGVEGESIQLYLDTEGIAVSTGSACAAGNGQPSHVLMAATHDPEIAHSSIRFSFGPNSTKKDITHVMSVLPEIINKLRNISTIRKDQDA